MTIEIETAAGPALPPRSHWDAMHKGLMHKCPKCGTGALYTSYLKVADTCGHCGEELHHQRADDAPPYFTILIVGHFVVGGILSMEKAFSPPGWVHSAVWLPMTVLSSLWLLPRVKGALIALQWALYMHGFEEAWRRNAPKPVEHVA